MIKPLFLCEQRLNLNSTSSSGILKPLVLPILNSISAFLFLLLIPRPEWNLSLSGQLPLIICVSILSPLFWSYGWIILGQSIIHLPIPWLHPFFLLLLFLKNHFQAPKRKDNEPCHQELQEKYNNSQIEQVRYHIINVFHNPYLRNCPLPNNIRAKFTIPQKANSGKSNT